MKPSQSPIPFKDPRSTESSLEALSADTLKSHKLEIEKMLARYELIVKPSTEKLLLLMFSEVKELHKLSQAFDQRAKPTIEKISGVLDNHDSWASNTALVRRLFFIANHALVSDIDIEPLLDCFIEGFICIKSNISELNAHAVFEVARCLADSPIDDRNVKLIFTDLLVPIINASENIDPVRLVKIAYEANELLTFGKEIKHNEGFISDGLLDYYLLINEQPEVFLLEVPGMFLRAMTTAENVYQYTESRDSLERDFFNDLLHELYSFLDNFEGGATETNVRHALMVLRPFSSKRIYVSKAFDFVEQLKSISLAGEFDELVQQMAYSIGFMMLRARKPSEVYSEIIDTVTNLHRLQLPSVSDSLISVTETCCQNQVPLVSLKYLNQLLSSLPCTLLTGQLNTLLDIAGTQYEHGNYKKINGLIQAYLTSRVQPGVYYDLDVALRNFQLLTECYSTSIDRLNFSVLSYLDQIILLDLDSREKVYQEIGTFFTHAGGYSPNNIGKLIYSIQTLSSITELGRMNALLENLQLKGFKFESIYSDYLNFFLVHSSDFSVLEHCINLGLADFQFYGNENTAGIIAFLSQETEHDQLLLQARKDAEQDLESSCVPEPVYKSLRLNVLLRRLRLLGTKEVRTCYSQANKLLKLTDSLTKTIKALKNGIYEFIYFDSEDLVDLLEFFNSDLDHQAKLQEIKNELHFGKKTCSTTIELAALRSLVGHDNPHARNRDYTEHINYYSGRRIPLTLKMPDSDLTIETAHSDQDISLLPGKFVDPTGKKFIIGQLQHAYEHSEQVIDVLTDMYGLNEKDFIDSAYQQAVELEKSGNLKILKTYVNLLTQVLIAQNKIEIPDLNTPQEIYDFYGCVNDQIVEHILSEFSLNGLDLKALTRNDKISIQKRQRNLFTLFKLQDRLESEIDKFVMKNYAVGDQVGLMISKGMVDVLYGDLGENCINDSGFELEREIFQPIRMYSKLNLSQLGVVYALKAKLFGEPAMLLAGVEPKRDFVARIDTMYFIKGLVRRLKEIGRYNSLTKLYTVATDDGRIANLRKVEKTLLKVAKGEILTVPEEEWIIFPNGYRPISKVLEL